MCSVEPEDGLPGQCMVEEEWEVPDLSGHALWLDLQRGLRTGTGFQRVLGQNHRITESQNNRGWKGPLWVI